jgi:hypothetical protein
MAVDLLIATPGGHTVRYVTQILRAGRSSIHGCWPHAYGCSNSVQQGESPDPHEAGRGCILLIYRYGLQAEEQVSPRGPIDRKGAALTIHRKKGGTPAPHSLQAIELRTLSALRRAQPDTEYIFTRGMPRKVV